ncbi:MULTISPECIES: hypothetical protein [Streptomyces]|uniref:Uncharacterized protein n=1 Tax=Streptomyces ramulosus TaxID=47762 RepID=A0ABW1FAZ1_9ACTN
MSHRRPEAGPCPDHHSPHHRRPEHAPAQIGRLKVTKFWYDLADGGATFDAVVWEKG